MTSLFITLIAIVLFSVVAVSIFLYFDADEAKAIGNAPLAVSMLGNVVEASEAFRQARGNYPLSIEDLRTEFELESVSSLEADFIIDNGVACLSLPYRQDSEDLLQIAKNKFAGAVVTDTCGDITPEGRRLLAFSMDGKNVPVATAFVPSGSTGSSGGSSAYPFPSTMTFAAAGNIGEVNCGPAESWSVLHASGPAYYADWCAASANQQFPMWEKQIPIPASYADEMAAGVTRVTFSTSMMGYSGDSDRARLYLRCLDADGRQLAFDVGGFHDPSTWSTVSIAMDIPAQCQSVFGGTMAYRASGTENSIYFRDFRYAVEGGDGNRQVVSFASFMGNDILAWTLEQGNVSPTSTYYYSFPSVKASGTSVGIASTVVDIPEEILLAVEAAQASLDISTLVFNWGGQDDRGRIFTKFILEDGSEVDGPSTGNLAAPSSLGTMYKGIGDVPTNARAVRFIYETQRVDGSNSDYNPFHIGANFILQR